MNTPLYVYLYKLNVFLLVHCGINSCTLCKECVYFFFHWQYHNVMLDYLLGWGSDDEETTSLKCRLRLASLSRERETYWVSCHRSNQQDMKEFHSIQYRAISKYFHKKNRILIKPVGKLCCCKCGCYSFNYNFKFKKTC